MHRFTTLERADFHYPENLNSNEREKHMFNQNKKGSQIQQADKKTKERTVFKKSGEANPKPQEDKDNQNEKSGWKSDGGRN